MTRESNVVRLPLMFERVGETTFRARSRGYSVSVEPGRVNVAVPGGDAIAPAAVTLEFLGAQSPTLGPEQPLETVINVLKGKPNTWRTGVKTFGQVRMAGIYPGIDAVFYGNDRQLEYDFIVAAGVSPGQIAMRFAAADHLTLNATGDLVITKAGRELTQHKPVVYQEVDGRHVYVAANYVIDGDVVRFQLAPYDTQRPLVIDPVISYATYWGATDSDRILSAATDDAGNLLVAGLSQSGDFPRPGSPAHRGSGEFGVAADAYVAKIAPSGLPLWVTFIGGDDHDYATDIALGPGGHIYLTGGTSSIDFPATAAAYDSTGHNDRTEGGEPGDAFIVRLSTDGRTMVAATYFGGGEHWGPDVANAIAVDAFGRPHIVGETGTADFPVTIPESRGRTLTHDNRDAFVARFSADLARLEFSRLLAGAEYEAANDILLDPNGGIFVVGSTSSVDFPVKNAVQATKYGPNGVEGEDQRDGFLTHLWTNGGIVYSTFLGGPGEDNLYAIARGLFSRLYVAGNTTSDTLANAAVRRPGAGDPWNTDGFIMHIVPNATVILSTRFVGGSADDSITDLAIDPAMNVWLAGTTASADITRYLSPGAFQTALNGQRDILVNKRGPDLSLVEYGTLIGGSGMDTAFGITVDGHGNAYVVGSSWAPDFPVVNAVQPSLAPASAAHRAEDGVIAKLGCTVAVERSKAVSAGAGTGSLAISVESGCRAVATSGAAWLRVTQTDSDSVDFTFDANSATSPRTATIDVSGTTVTVTQAGASTPPASDTPLEIVLSPSVSRVVHGTWRSVAHQDGSLIEDMAQADAGAAKVNTALANPANYFELTFNAEAGRPYRLWIRGKAENDYWGNDSVHVQFLESVDASGNPAFRIGTASATSVNLEECSGCGVRGWGWEDNGWGANNLLGPAIYFARTGPQTIRIQQREDGFQINQIVLSAERYLHVSPGASKDDTTMLPFTNWPSDGGTGQPQPGPPPSTSEIVLTAGDFATAGTWEKQADPGSATGVRLRNANQGAPKVNAPLAAPADYVEATFNAEAGKPYRLWLRMFADTNYWGNDSVWVQFSGTVNAGGTAIHRIGTTAGTWINLEECSGCGLQGWGWQDDGYGAPGQLGTVIYFAQSGPQKIRIQTREDGVSIDQVVISAGTYLNAAPGAAKNDSTKLK
jgi:hypothetical protein